MTGPTQATPPPGGRGGGIGGGSNNSGPTQTTPPPAGRGGPNNNSGPTPPPAGRGGPNNNSGPTQSGFTMPDMPSFMANNNFNGGFGYGRGDPINNFFGSGYGYPGYPLDGGYSNSGGGGQNNSLQVNVSKLDGSNYAEWSQTVRLVIEGKGKLGFLTGDVPVPATTHPNYRFWKSENSTIIAWLINTMEVGMRKTYMYLPTAKDVWDAVKLSYSDIKSFSQIYDLKSKLWNLKQNDMDVTTYYNELMALWQELDQCYDYNWRCTEDSAQFINTQENDRVFVFLAGLNKELDEVRGRILGNNPLPTLRETYSDVRRE